MPNELRVIFDDLNRKFFRGRMRRCRVRWAQLPQPILGRYLRHRRLIEIKRGLRALTLKAVLLHEMVHARGHLSHGPLFDLKLVVIVTESRSAEKRQIARHALRLDWGRGLDDLLRLYRAECRRAKGARHDKSKQGAADAAV